jgi:hypothetical protein
MMIRLDLQHFCTFVQSGAEGITAETYLGAAVSGHFFPSFGFHFKPHNGIWPTDINPIKHFAEKMLVSLEAQDYNAVTIEVHGDHLAPIPSLLTCNQLSMQHHCNTTPWQTGALTSVTMDNPAALNIPTPVPSMAPVPSPYNPCHGQKTAGTPTLPSGRANPEAPLPV